METNKNRMYSRICFFILLIIAFAGFSLTGCNTYSTDWSTIGEQGKSLMGYLSNDNHPESTGNTNEDIENEKLVKELEMLGGAGGSLIPRLFKKDTDNAAVYALIGSQSGKMYGIHLINLEKKCKGQEDTLEASVNETKEINKATKEYNDSLNEKIITLQDDSVKIDKEMEQGMVDKKELDKHKEEVEKELAATNEVLKIAKTRLSDKKEKLEKVKKTQGAEFVKLEEQIKVLENEIVELKQSVDELTDIDQKYGA